MRVRTDTRGRVFLAIGGVEHVITWRQASDLGRNLDAAVVESVAAEERILRSGGQPYSELMAKLHGIHGDRCICEAVFTSSDQPSGRAHNPDCPVHR